MKMTCEACHTVYDSFGDDVATSSCPCCEHVNRPHEQAEPVESVDAVSFPSEDTADPVDAPLQTMVFPADEDARGTGQTDVRNLRAKGRPTIGEGVGWKLVTMEKGKPGRAHPVRKSRVTIGRGHCDIRLRNPEVSREHCAIEVYGARAIIKDLKSANGTLVNGRLIREHIIKDGDHIQIGSTIFQVLATPVRKAA